MTEVMDRIAHYTREFFKCYLCNKIFADGDEPWHMFEKRLTENGQSHTSLAAILSSALGKDLEEHSVHSKLICDECNLILLEYERIEKSFYHFRVKILNDYNHTAKENNFEPIWFEIGNIDDSVQMMQLQEGDDGNLTNETQTLQPPQQQGVVEEEAEGHDEEDFTHEMKPAIVEGLIAHIPIMDSQEISNLVIEEKGEQEYEEILPDDVIVQELDATETILIGNPEEDLESGEALPVVYDEKNNLHVIAEEIPYEQIIEQTSVISYDNSIDDVHESAIDYNSSNDDNPPIIPEDVPISIKKQKRNNRSIKREQQDQQSTDQQQLGLEFVFTGAVYLCALCPEQTEHEPMLFSNHLKTVHNYKFYVCDICYKGFHKRNEVSEHMDEFHASGAEEGEFHCDNCMRVFLNLRQFRIHKRLHYTSTKQHECSECHKKYSSKNLLDEHMNMHTGKRPFKCASCSKDFASKYTLQAHMKIHTKRPRPYSCDKCDKSFLNQQNLVQHAKLHLGLKTFICEVCQKAFGTQHNLDVHKIVHSGNKPFICRTCGKGFARRAEIRDHERTHTGERPFKCDLCTLAFAQRSNLMTHKKATHLNDKKHKCNLCDRSFKRRRLLEYHTQSAHTGERPHKCEVCSATFVYPEHFKKHMRIHSGVKPYACEVCGKMFNSRDNRNAHRFIHSEKKPYECLECGMGFMRKPLLLSHMKHTKHVNDTIIVNQPQISHKGVLEVYKETTDEEEDDLVLETTHQEGVGEAEEDANIAEEEEEAGYDEVVASDTILVEDGDGQYIKDEDGEVKYLQFAEMDKDGQATFTWVDIAEDKEDDN
ncbi:zinc finger protein 502-like [Eupeodes corollae]|uniref:zinc finger protein 502-like n=1 Tax=Eupeodes corollae TaxID=290404 RepID=UPI0024924C34|nr:zinc finger protein 502-like [Eupeodes corollae]